MKKDVWNKGNRSIPSDAIMIKEFESGKSYLEISDYYNVSPGYISVAAKRLGFQKIQVILEKKTEGLSDRAISRLLGVSNHTVADYYRKAMSQLEVMTPCQS